MSGSAAGFVYVATGENYRREAAASAASLRVVDPRARICLLTDRADGPRFWDDLVILEQPVFGFRDKLEMWRCPYDRWVFLDTDTLVIAGLDEVFALLDRFDFAGHQLFEGHDYRPDGVPDAFPDFNTGVLGFRRSEATDRLFRHWAELYERYRGRNRDGVYHPANVSDQQSLRVALYESDLRLTILGPEYNFIPYHLNFACAPVRVLHGRGRFERIAGRINREYGNRAYVPRLDAIVTAEPHGRDLRRLWWMASLQLLRALGVTLTPLALRDRLRRLSAIRRLLLRNDFGVYRSDHARKWQEQPGPPADR